MKAGQVLLVNSFDDWHVYADLLQEQGHTVVEATMPEEALRFLAASDPPDVVLTDIVFVGSAIAGTSFIRELRLRVDGATSIVVLTRYMRADDRHEARAAGADLFLMKPAVPAAVLFEVQRALILRRGGRRLSWNWAARPAAAALSPAHERRRVR
jgi:CheY-like chemotaxis protein